MAKKSQAWKDLERLAAEVLGGKRVVRGDYGVGDVDVVVEDFPNLKVDGKYRTNHAHHSLLETIRRKYCKNEYDIPVLVTRHHHQRGANVTIPLAALGDILDTLRTYRKLLSSRPVPGLRELAGAEVHERPVNEAVGGGRSAGPIALLDGEAELLRLLHHNPERPEEDGVHGIPQLQERGVGSEGSEG